MTMLDAPTLMPCPRKHDTVEPIADHDIGLHGRAEEGWRFKCRTCGWTGPRGETQIDALDAWNFERSPSPLRELRGWLDERIDTADALAKRAADRFTTYRETYEERKRAYESVRQWLEREGGGGNG